MAIRTERLLKDIQAISEFTETPGNGATRPTFSRSWGEASQYIADQAIAAGCEIRTDAAGNLHARPSALGWEAPAWLCGSHIDTVPNGGDFDGVAGIIVALEVLRSASDDSISALPLELINFADEEGPTFGVGMLGSRAWVGELSVESLEKLTNAAGQNYFQAGAAFGADASKLSADRIRPSRYLGLVEVHIEQGPGMWQRDQRVAVVRAIAGRIQYGVTLHGQANHAGATRMTDRHDALAGAAEIILELERLSPRISDDTVLTVGRILNHPNAVNVIPGRVELTIDLRAAEDATIIRADTSLRQCSAEICNRRGLRLEIQRSESIAARPMDAKLCDRLSCAAHFAGQENIGVAVSGALHDSAVLAKYIPTAMLFVPSRDGISHNPAEFSRVEDIAAAASVVEQLVRRPTVSQVNKFSRDRFVAVCGPMFEQSPWIAERAWNARPFNSLSDLHEKLIATVARSSSEEQLSLIRAHPDLVGRLAREGRLTRESAAEQAAAGLESLSPSEITAFEQYNAEYQRKFGFPFVICARQNRKEAILAAFAKRLANSREAEQAAALAEIYKIAQLRLADAFWEN